MDVRFTKIKIKFDWINFKKKTKKPRLTEKSGFQKFIKFGKEQSD